MHEVITLQLGQRANYLATHFWNLQESYFTYGENEESLVNHDVHFRAGVGADGTDTFTPRTVIYDLKGGFGSLRKYNALYELTDKSAPVRGLWEGATLTQQQGVIEPTKYQKNLDQGLPTFQLHASDVRYWSDFNRVFYHPRSIVQINEYELNSQLMPFESWNAGEELYHTLDKEFDLLDRDVRPFAEECDQLQALQLFTGADDAWGGFSSRYMEDLRDEFGKTSIWVWALEDSRPAPRQRRIARACNAAHSLRSIGQQASAYLRMSSSPANLPGYVNLDTTSEWITSAFLCSIMESSTLPTRLLRAGGRQGSFGLLEAALNTTGKQTVFEIRSSVEPEAENPVNGPPTGSSNQRGETIIHEDTNDLTVASNFDINLFPVDGISRTEHTFSQIESLRHASSARLTLPNQSSNASERSRQRLEEKTIIEKFDSRVPFPSSLDTFPDTLFHDQNSTTGLDIRTGLVCTSRTKSQITCLRNLTSRAFDVEEREGMYNDLTEMANAYGHGWDSGSDSGEDS